MGRSLQLLVNELCHLREGLGFQRLLGVRDQAHAIFRLHTRAAYGGDPIPPKCMEKDMDDMFWEIPLDQIMIALEWAHKKLRGKRQNLWFSIAKGGQRHLDRVGTASSSDFTTISFEEVKRYVLFDSEFCNLFTIAEHIIQQGLKGVPIGGYLSAQLAKIWATWREATFLYGDNKHVTETLVNAPASTWWDAEHPTQRDTLGPPLYPLLSPSGETDFTMGSLEAFNMQYMEGMMRNRSIGLVNREVLCEGGFDGWWSPVEKLIGCINYPNGTRAVIAQTLPWDGAVGGRVDTILKVHGPP